MLKQWAICLKNIITTMDLNLKNKIKKTLERDLKNIQNDLEWWQKKSRLNYTPETISKIYSLLKEKQALLLELKNCYGHKN